MSNALAIAGVTAVLRDLLDSGLIDHDVTDAMGQGVSVTAVAPDTVRIEGPEARPQLNLFLYQATPNAAWRNVGLPSRDRNGQRLGNPPLALDLHYLVTAYGTGDLQAEVLLGYAMQLLHETPMLSRDAIRTALDPPNAPVDGGMLPAVYEALRASDLAEQYEQIKIAPAPMGSEEMSKLWSAIQAHYRPTAAYQVSVVLIEATQPARAPLPVLSRGPVVTSLVDPNTQRESGIAVAANLGPTWPQVDAVELPNQQTAAHLGDTVALGGAQFDGADQILLLSLPRLDIEQAIAPPSAVAADRIEFVIPDQPTDYPAGNYSMALQVLRPGESQPRTTEQVSLRIAPRITSLVSPPQVFPRGNDDDHVAIVTLSCSPEVRPTQRVSLIIGSREVVADDHPATTADLAFTVRDAPLGVHYVRLRVDGVDSQLVDRGKSPPAYFDHRIEIA
jgi:hypothetical protein